MATGPRLRDRKISWHLETGKRFVTSEIFSLDITLISQAQKDADLAKGYKGRWHESFFNPSLQFKITCPNNEPRVISNMDDFVNFGYQMACFTMKTPPGQVEFTITVEYDEMVEVPCQMDIIQGIHKTEEGQRRFFPSTPVGDTSHDSGLGLQSPLGCLTFSPEDHPRATVSPPRGTGSDFQSN